MALGSIAQWLAWRFKLPSILLLLIFGFVAGPITGPDLLLNPSLLQDAEWLFAYVSLAVGIILFEGGLTLRLDELREVGRAVLNLITVGVAITWLLAGLAAYYLIGSFQQNVSLAILTGAILTVTGPTVVIPLLRHVRPSGRVGTIAKWEGITIDPVGAILAVLVLETILLLNEPTGGQGSLAAAFHALEGIFTVLFVSVGVSTAGAVILVFLLRRRMIPDYLLNPIALTVVVAAFVVSNWLQPESGLLTAVLMGIMLANQSYASVQRIMDFKEDLQVLLLASLFILLSARLELSILRYIDANVFLFLGALVLIIRPIAVLFSSLGTQLSWQEKVFMSWIAPRGVVAAAVASLFAFRLQEHLPGTYPEEVVAPLVPIVFLVIVGTVAFYGLTLSPVARWLDLAQPNPQGVVFVGAHSWAKKLARALQEHGIQVLLIDSNPSVVRQAQKEDLPAQQADVLREGIMEKLDFSGIGRLLAVTPNDEVNSLAALHFAEVFDSTEVHQLAAHDETQVGEKAELPMHLRGHSLFEADATYKSLTERFDRGAQVLSLEVQKAFTYERFRERYGKHVTPLFLIRRNGNLYIFSEEPPPSPQPGNVLLVLADPEIAEEDLQAASNHQSPATQALEHSAGPDGTTDGEKENT